MPALMSHPTTAAYSTSIFHSDFYAAERSFSAQTTHRITGEMEHNRTNQLTFQSAFLDTPARLLLTRVEKLLPTIWQDWQSKQDYLTSVDSEEALVRVRRLLLTVPLAASTISAGFTYEQSLYVRAELPGQDGGTLYIEVNLGDDADATEDSFVSIRQNKQEKWAMSGPFIEVLTKLRHIFSA